MQDGRYVIAILGKCNQPCHVHSFIRSFNRYLLSTELGVKFTAVSENKHVLSGKGNRHYLNSPTNSYVVRMVINVQRGIMRECEEEAFFQKNK